MFLSKVRSHLIAPLFKNCQEMAKSGAHFSVRVPPPPLPPQAVLQHYHHHHRLALYRSQQEQKEVLQPGRLFSRFFSSRVPSSSFSEEGERARGRAPSNLHQKQLNEEIGGLGPASRGQSSPPLLVRLWVIIKSERSKTCSMASRNSRANKFADVCRIELPLCGLPISSYQKRSHMVMRLNYSYLTGAAAILLSNFYGSASKITSTQSFYSSILTTYCSRLICPISLR